MAAAANQGPSAPQLHRTGAGPTLETGAGHPVDSPESAGKTTLTLSVVAEAQRNGGLAAFIDVEHALEEAPLIPVEGQDQRQVQ